MSMTREEAIKYLKFSTKAKEYDKDLDVVLRKENEAIRTLLSELEELDKTNNDLRMLYRRTATKLKENGREDLAEFFLAQINEIPTFTIDDDIDYYAEYQRMKKELEEKEEQMNIFTKYNIGDRIWAIYKHRGETHVYSTTIVSITYENDKILYYTNDDSCEDFKEDEIILYDDIDTLTKKLIELDNENIEENEYEN